jgi:hypothetical protein
MHQSLAHLGIRLALALWDLEVPIHIHAVVENSGYNDPGFGTGSVKDNMAALAELFVPWLYFTRIEAYFRLASE